MPPRTEGDHAGEERRALLHLRLLPGVGDRVVSRLLSRYRSARAILSLGEDHFREVAGEAAALARSSGEAARAADRVLDRCDREGIGVHALGDDGYPARLLRLPDPPPVLFSRGAARIDPPRAVAVIGSRRATPVGRRLAERLARDLSEAGVVVVSGMALGIDGAAHRGALEGRGGTLAVLGAGPERAHPSAHRTLFERIVRAGVVVSEFPPGERARPHHFPRRNRVLAALSHAVVVVEAAARSGALITAEHALDLGVEVCAVPGSVESPNAEGVHALLRDGAHLVTDAADLLEVMGWQRLDASDRTPADGERSPSASDPRWATISPGREGGAATGRVLDALGLTPVPVDVLVERVGLPAPRVLAALSRLELDGRVRRHGDGWAAGDVRHPGAR